MVDTFSGAEAGLSIFRSFGWRLMKAPVEFRAPEQRAPKDQPNIAWWFIPIAIRRPYFWRQLSVPSAAIYLIPTTGDESNKIIPNAIPLVLQYPQDVPNGEFHREANLQYGRVVFVPLARRDENGNGEAVITGNSCLLQEQNGPIIPAGTRTRFQLLIRYGRSKWQQSPSFYTIYVPPAGASNGQFSVEMRYGDEAY